MKRYGTYFSLLIFMIFLIIINIHIGSHGDPACHLCLILTLLPIALVFLEHFTGFSSSPLHRFLRTTPLFFPSTTMLERFPHRGPPKVSVIT